MGVVWKARDTRLARLVALKLLPPDRTDVVQARSRLLREARAASALNHPNIVTVHDILTVDGADCIVMEYVEGQTLDAMLREGGLGFDRFFEIAIPLCDAIAKAHSAGIIHRDLKPSNVMVTADGVVKVLDFGLAKAVDASAFPSASGQTIFEPTAAGVIMGTVSYMSPEQASGRTMDSRSDVFSLGIVLYQMLTGVNPFEAENTMSTLERVYTTQPEPVTMYRNGTPSALEWCIDKALRKKPEDRYRDAAALREELKRASVDIHQSSTRATGAMRRQVVQAAARTMKLWWPAATVVVVLTAGVWFGRGYFSDRVEPEISESASAFDLTTRAQGYLRRFYRIANIDRAIQILGRAVQRDPDHAPAWAALAEAYWLKYRESPDKVLLNTAAGHAQKAVQLNPDLAVGHVWLGAVLAESGKREEALNEYRRAIELDPNSVDAHRLLGVGLAGAQRYGEAEKSLRKAAELANDDWRVHNSLAVFLYGRNRVPEAIAAFERTRDLTKENATVYRNLAAAYHMVGRDEDAATALQRSLEIQETAAAYTNLGTLRFYQGRFPQAADAMERAIKLDANKHVMWGNLADAYRWTPDRAAKASGAYERAIDLVRQRLAASPQDPDLRSSLATYLSKLKRQEEALGEINAALAITPRKSGVLFKAAIVFELAGKRDQAVDMLGQAAERGYNWKQIANDPEFVALRRDPRFHLLAAKRTP